MKIFRGEHRAIFYFTSSPTVMVIFSYSNSFVPRVPGERKPNIKKYFKIIEHRKIYKYDGVGYPYKAPNLIFGEMIGEKGWTDWYVGAQNRCALSAAGGMSWGGGSKGGGREGGKVGQGTARKGEGGVGWMLWNSVRRCLSKPRPRAV